MLQFRFFSAGVDRFLGLDEHEVTQVSGLPGDVLDLLLADVEGALERALAAPGFQDRVLAKPRDSSTHG